MDSKSLRGELAPRIAPVVLANITTRHPYHDSHLFRQNDGPFEPLAVHPAFGNSYDWHSSVHSHWTALQLLAFFAAGGVATTSIPGNIVDALRSACARTLAAKNLEAEASYLEARPTYERPYGWAWAMRLAADASEFGASDPSAALHRLARAIADRAVAWLHAMPGPVRHGVHSNSAYALGLMLDASHKLGFDDLATVIGTKAMTWYGGDRDYPAAWERSANDFLSPGLTEADLMRRILTPGAFTDWWRGFVCDGVSRDALFAVAEVPRVSDGQIVHLHGLNLSRAGALARIAAVVETAPALELLDRARTLYDASVAEASGAEYLSTHWLPTFAWDTATSLDAAGAKGASRRHRERPTP
ncbi:MAG TPA: DUF2891 family protein [Candidatus Eremiobacteraceae bacterium]|nr:DUF2891 family protein [Candidatus Eremiobacteraceae bacterium]